MPQANGAPVVGVVMGSASDWDGTMRHTAETLDGLNIANEVRVLSAHRTPDDGQSASRHCFHNAIISLFTSLIITIKNNNKNNDKHF